MKELIGQILSHARGAWRFRWHALGAAWSLALIGWIVALLQPDIYETRTRVYVDSDSVLRPLLTGLAVNTDVSNRVNMMSRVLMGRPNLERVARETDLYLRAPTPADFEALVTSLAINIGLEGGGRDNVYSLRYSDKDPAMAQRVVQALLDVFVEDTLGGKRADSDSAQQFLQTQIREYDNRLRQAEDRLADFKKRNVGLMPGETGDYYTRSQTASGLLQDLRAKQRLALQRRSELEKQLQGEEPTFGIFAEANTGTADGQIAEYRRQLEQLLLQYTDKHPRVLALRDTIAQLEARDAASNSRTGRSAAVPRDPAAAAGFALDINPVYQNIRIQLSRTQVELAELRQQISEQEALVGALRSRVDTIPQTEAELARLNRDYEVNKAQHQALLQRLESARLSERAETNAEGVKFRIIEPPTAPLIPASPNRALLLTAVLLSALAAGAAVAFALDQMRPVFWSRGLLAAVTGLPVLGAISLTAPAAQPSWFRREPVLVAAAYAGLVATYALAMRLADPAGKLLRTLAG